ncbi:DUF4403 family protein [Pontibacter toksunensis]|uniref:DUF4403 family protein n=1 Tax=Pontibacter toksunensis TaxID=1332631 RepID=A0ABW6C1B9_9BACT
MMESSIIVQVPISISYPALEGVLKKKMVGQPVPKPEPGVQTPPYGQILDIGISGSSTGAYDVILRIKLRILRTVLKRDQVDLYVFATLGYDNATQQLFVRKFKMNSRTSSGFYNAALEMLINNAAYNQIIKKARVNLSQIISEELNKANSRLEEGLELKGVKVLGAVQGVRVQDIIPQQDKVSLSFELQGNLELEIDDLISLMPAE